MRLSLIVAASLLSSTALIAQPAKGFTPGTYAFLPRTSSFDPQFDAWRTQVVADSFKVIDPSGAVFLISVGKMVGDTLMWTDVAGPCTGVASKYKFSQDTIGIMLDLIDDACTDRAAAIVHIYFAPAKPSGDTALERPRRYTNLRVLGHHQ